MEPPILARPNVADARVRGRQGWCPWFQRHPGMVAGGFEYEIAAPDEEVPLQSRLVSCADDPRLALGVGSLEPGTGSFRQGLEFLKRQDANLSSRRKHALYVS